MSDQSIAEFRQYLNVIATKISHYLSASDWEQLSVCLTERQNYLEQVLTASENIGNKAELTELVRQLLEQDKQSLALIQAQQQKILALHTQMEQGIRAAKAYGAKR